MVRLEMTDKQYELLRFCLILVCEITHIMIKKNTIDLVEYFKQTKEIQ